MKHTKHKLLSSIATLFVCLAMFIGSTYAWFTDSASTGVNKIQAGNLDLVVEHKNAKETSYETIETKTNLFQDGNGEAMKWEPGAMSWETFKVSNKGNLAFKYVLQTNITGFNTVNGTDKSLKDVLKVMVLEGNRILSNPTRENVAAMDWSSTTHTLDSFVKGDGKLYPNGTTGQISSEEFQVIVYWMPTANDNDWNVNNDKTTSDQQPLFIDFGIKVLATQLDHESDSFDNTYDKNATYSESITTTVDNTKNTVFVSNATPSNEVGKTTTVEFPKETASLTNGLSMKLDIEASPVTTANNNFVVGSNGAVGAIDLKATVGDNIVTEFMNSSGQPVAVKVTTYIAKNLTNVTLNCGDEQWNNVGAETAVDANKFYYKSSTGKLVFGTSHFSTFVVGADEAAYVSGINTAYTTISSALDSISENGKIVLLKNIEENVVIPVDKTVSLDLNGHTLTNNGDHTILNRGNLTVSGNGTVDNITHAKAALYNEVGATATLNGGLFTRSKENGISKHENGGNSYYAILNHSTMTINKGVSVIQNGQYSSLLENGWQNGNQATTDIAKNVNLTINGGTFKGGLNTIKNDDWGVLTINGGDFSNIAQHAVLNWNVATINGGTFECGGTTVYIGKNYNNQMDQGKLTVTGGTFNYNPSYYGITGEDSTSQIEITGGKYISSNVSNASLPNGYKLIQEGNRYKVVSSES